MECPHCGKTDNDVIDSRQTKEGIAIRRRRHCLACGSRFTTYECTAEKLLRVLVNDDAVRGPTLTNLKTVLGAISSALKALTEGTEKLIQKEEKAEAAKGRAKEVPAKRKAAAPTVTDQLLKIIKRFEKGVDVATLKKRTGFEDRKMRNILY
jgi:transcriptional regulator NrdR family protein